MPMKPAAPDSTAPIRKPTGDQPAEEEGQQHEDHDADDADRRVLALEIGLRAFVRPRRRSPACARCRRPLSSRKPSPRWRKRSKALRRAQSPIMLSLNLPQIFAGLAPRLPRERGRRIKRRPSLPKGRPQIGGTMPKSSPRRNAAEAKNRRFLKGITGKSAGQRRHRASGCGLRSAQNTRTRPTPQGRAGSLAISVHP